MRRATIPRCPYCWTLALREDGSAPIPGMLVICVGCAAPSRFEGERLIRLENADIPENQRGAVLDVQRGIREMHGPRGMPPGYCWGAGAVCASCWNEMEPERPAISAVRVTAEPCELCGEWTRDGIYRRMLLRVKEGAKDE